MTPLRLIVEQAGPLTSIQDAGRPGLMRFGVPRSGPVDRRAFAAPHAALGNPAGGSAIELSHGGITLRGGDAPLAFALTGDGFAASIDGAPLGDWVMAVLPPGARLVVRDGGGAAAGNWGYLAIAGHIAAPAWLGSTATHAIANLGGGRIIAGDTIAVEARAPMHDAPIALPAPAANGNIRIVIGPQQRFFAADAIDTLLAGPWRTGAAFDRMGTVLDGPPLLPTVLTMLSEPLVRGTLQANGAGMLTALLADHQSTGGYPRPATVIGADIDRLAQLRPGTPLRFASVTVEQAIAAARSEAAATTAWLAAVANPASLEDRLHSTNLIDGIVDAAEHFRPC